MGADNHVGVDSQTLEKGPEAEQVAEYGPADDARVRWKLDIHMMPLFFVLCIYLLLTLCPARAHTCPRYAGLPRSW